IAVAREGRGATPLAIERFHEHAHRFLREGVGGEPPLCELHGLPPARASHGLARGGTDDVLTLAEEARARAVEPLVEGGCPTPRETGEEARDVVLGGLARVGADGR